MIHKIAGQLAVTDMLARNLNLTDWKSLHHKKIKHHPSRLEFFSHHHKIIETNITRVMPTTGFKINAKLRMEMGTLLKRQQPYQRADNSRPCLFPIAKNLWVNQY